MSPAVIEDLRNRLSGELVTPDSPGYDPARRVFTRLIARRPAAIARCRGTADLLVVCAVAREHGLPLAVRGGAHNIAGYGTCDDGLVADLSLMRGVRVDPVAGTARVQGGARWADLDAESQVFGLATTGGQVSTTGVVGLTVGGGWGTLARKLGLACDNLVAADVVTVDGEVLGVDRDREPDLFWAIRGGGGNFGIVTSVELALHPVGPVVTGGLVIHPFDRGPHLLEFFRDYMSDRTEDVSADIMFMTAPPVPQLPTELHNRPVAAIFARHVGSPELAEKELEPLRAFGPPIADLVGPLPYAVLQRSLETATPPEQCHYWTAGYVADLTPSVVDEVMRWAEQRPDPRSMVVVIPWSGQIVRAEPAATAFGQRLPGWLIHTLGSWEDAAVTDAGMAWATAMGQAIRKLGSGTSYLNFTPEAGDDRLDLFYDRERLSRLSALKARYDPANLLRFNQNIAPD
jgi:FAD/FMN-containing dehydrogenase